MKPYVIFSGQDAEARLARFIAELLRLGIRFTVQNDEHSYEVHLTGGY